MDVTETGQQGMLSRGLAILSALGDRPNGASVTEVSREVGLAVSTTHRLLRIAIDAGFAEFDSVTKQYRLGTRIFELAHKATGAMSMAEAARPVMRTLSRTTGETVQMAISSRGRALFLEKVWTEQAVGIRGAIGDSEPMHLTSTGKILLAHMDPRERDTVLGSGPLATTTPNSISDRAALEAHLEQAATDDYAVADEEFDAGVRAIAVPIRDGRGLLRAALCISAPAFRVSLVDLRQWLPDLRAAGDEIGVRLPQHS